MATRMQQRRGTAQQWLDASPVVLAAGEIGFETDTNQFKIGDGTTEWQSLSYFKNLADLDTDGFLLASDKGIANGVASLDSTGNIPVSQLGNLIDGAPNALNTLNELAAALDDDASFAATITNALANQDAALQNAIDTVAQTNADDMAELSNTLTGALSAHDQDTSVHGIANTLLLVDQAILANTVTDTLASAGEYTSNAIADHASVTANVHGIANTLAIVFTDDARLSDERTPSAGSVTAEKIATEAVETAKLANNAVTNVKIADDAVDTAEIKDGAVTNAKLAGSIAQSKITDLSTDLSAKANSLNPSFTVSNVLRQQTGSIQIVSDSANLININNSYWGNTQWTESASSVGASLTISGTSGMDGTYTINSVSQGMGGVTFTINETSPVVGSWRTASSIVVATSKTISSSELAHLDGVSSAIQTQLDAKANLSGATFTGNVVATNVTISGDLSVSGTTTTVSANNLVVSDPLIYIGENNTGNLVDLGIVSSFDDGTYQHSGLVRDASDSKWKLFKGVTDEPTTVINFAQGSLDSLAVGALEATTVTPSSGIVFTDGTQTKVGVPSITTIPNAISSSATLATGEQDKFVPISGAATITLPSSGYSIGQSIDFYQSSGTGGQFDGTGVVGTPGLKLRTTYSVATAMKIDGGWLVFGDLSA